MSSDTELFELSKAVYEATGWYDAALVRPAVDLIPNYTSDYILEKLPKFVIVGAEEFWLKVTPFTEESWSAIYGNSQSMRYHKNADTPLKALLKLVIALNEAGELKL